MNPRVPAVLAVAVVSLVAGLLIGFAYGVFTTGEVLEAKTRTYTVIARPLGEAAPRSLELRGGELFSDGDCVEVRRPVFSRICGVLVVFEGAR